MTTACDQRTNLQLCVAKGHVRRVAKPASATDGAYRMQAQRPSALSVRVSGTLRVLGATATHARNVQGLVSSQLAEACQLNKHIKLLVNIYDEPQDANHSHTETHTDGLGKHTPSPALCLSYSHVRGHKPLFWKRALGSAVTAGFDFIWLFDADLVASGFPLQQMIISSTPS